MTDVATAVREGEDIVVTPRLGLLPELKSLGATWDPRARVWRLPAARMNAVALRDLLGDGLTLDMREEPEPEPVRYDDRLFGFQVGGVSRLLHASPRGQLMVASPGLGKTAMAIVAADEAQPDDQVVIVSPAPLLKTWKREIGVWARDPRVAIVHGGAPDWDEVRAARWIVTSWDILALHQDWFLDSWPLWILDESVMAKSRRSTRSMAMRGGRRKQKTKLGEARKPDKVWANLRKGVERVWLLSGSPTTRYADDLWAQLSLIWPKAFKSYWRFAERYCVIEENRWAPGPGTVVATRRDRDAVADNSDLITVINQKDVLDLPEYLTEAIDVDLTPKQRKAYDDMQRKFVAQLDAGPDLVAENRISQLTYLQQIVSWWDGSSAKHDAIIELILGGAWEFPMLIWTHWAEGAEALTDRLREANVDAIHVRGGMSQKKQDEGVEAYKRGDHDVLVFSLGVGKFGHTLTNTKTVIYVDKTWNADDYHQSLRRVRRIGLTHRPVLVTVRAPGTVDELVELNLEGKVEGISRVTNADLKELLLGLGR